MLFFSFLFFPFFKNQQCQPLFMRTSRAHNGTQLFMRLCANAPAASLIRGLFFPASPIMTLTVKEDEFKGLCHMGKINALLTP